MDVNQNPIAHVQPTIEQIRELQQVIGDMPQVELPLFHHFANNAYARELHIRAGVAIVGKMHRTQHFLIVAAGHISVTTSEGQEDIVGPRVIVTQPGTKRAIYAFTDAVLITTHVTTETDLDEIEHAIIVPEHLELTYLRQLEGSAL